MKREIKFRAIDWAFKRKWVYGHYFNGCVYPMSENRDYIYSQTQYSWGNIMIDISTLGQFTGMYDKDGEEIYEGDICSVNNEKYTIVFKGIGFWFQDEQFDLYVFSNEVYNIKIINNIHSHAISPKIN